MSDVCWQLVPQWVSVTYPSKWNQQSQLRQVSSFNRTAVGNLCQHLIVSSVLRAQLVSVPGFYA